MKVLLTGASGFLGHYLFKALSKTNDLFTIGRDASSDIIWDMKNRKVPELARVDAVVYCAGKAHSIPKSQDETKEFFRLNEEALIDFCNALVHQNSIPKHFVFISTVAVYGRDTGLAISEDHCLLGTSPYAKSKINAEHFLQDFCRKHGISLLILRLPLVIGSPPVGNLQSMIDGIKSGKYFRLGKGNAQKSMVLAEDVAELIASNLAAKGTFNLTDGRHPTFAELENELARLLKRKIKKMPHSLSVIAAWIGDVFPRFPLNTSLRIKIQSCLTFDDQKARTALNWQPRSVLQNLSNFS